MTITDKAGNTTSYSFTIDTTAPTLTISGLVKGEVTKDGFSASWSTAVGAGSNIANNRDALTVKYGVAASDYPSSASTTYSKQNTFLSNEGYYLMTIEDKAGNRSKYRVIVDQTAPAVSAPAEWLNTAFTYSASDPRGVTIEYRSNSGATGKVERTSYSVSQSASNTAFGNSAQLTTSAIRRSGVRSIFTTARRSATRSIYKTHIKRRRIGRCSCRRKTIRI